jgi:hypothetical protein
MALPRVYGAACSPSSAYPTTNSESIRNASWGFRIQDPLQPKELWCQQRPITSLLNKNFQPSGNTLFHFLCHHRKTNTQRFRNGRRPSVAHFSCCQENHVRRLVLSTLIRGYLFLLRALLTSSTYSNARKIIVPTAPSQQSTCRRESWAIATVLIGF